MQANTTKKGKDAMTQERKRILSVTIKHMIDESPDTSYLGEYGNHSESEYSIDRAHSQDCASASSEAEAVSNQIQRVIDYLYEQDLEDRDAIEVLEDAQEQITECDCHQHLDSRSYRYFNPNWQNYKGEPDPDIRKYCQQDYDRMESLNNQQWYYMGIRAEAEVQLTGDLCQKITSGGLWGVESDSSQDYIAEVGQEELSNLKAELAAIGFSKRAVAAAFRNVEVTP
jgi:hypothetical protein